MPDNRGNGVRRKGDAVLKSILWWVTAIVAGAVLGAATLATPFRSFMGTGLVQNGPWTMNPLAGSKGADPYAKLYIARTSVLALNKSETVYFEARIDDEGRALTPACDYVLKGPAPAARWWSVTAYGADDMLIANPGGRYSASAGSVSPGPDDLDIALTPDGSGPNGIATGEGGSFVLLLRLYQPAEDVRAAPDAVKLFAITRGACRS
jgi:hypothetical protein